jgi:hypothetical protein
VARLAGYVVAQSVRDVVARLVGAQGGSVVVDVAAQLGGYVVAQLGRCGGSVGWGCGGSVGWGYGG